MSDMCSPVSATHLQPEVPSLQTITTDEYLPLNWSPPQRVIEIKGGEKVILRGIARKDMHDIIDIVKTRNIVDFAESDIPCAMQCQNFGGVVAVNADGAFIGCCVFMQYGGRLYASGYLGVVASYRRNGITMQMKLYCLTYGPVSEGYEVFTYGRREITDFYSKINLQVDNQYGLFYRLVVNFSNTFLKTDCENDVKIRELTFKDIHDLKSFEKLGRYDESVHTFNRTELLNAICLHPTSRTFVAFCDNKICGYGILRKCFLSHKIAPLFADSPSVARSLYRRIGQESTTGGTLSMIVTNRNKAMMDIVEENSYEIRGELLRNRQTDNTSREDIGIDYSRVFSLTESHLSLC